MEWFHDCPYLVKSALLEKPIQTILNFVAALQRKSKVCIRHSSHTIFENFPKNIYIKKKCFHSVSKCFVSALCIISPDDPFVEELYSGNPKLHELYAKKHICLVFVDEKTFR